MDNNRGRCQANTDQLEIELMKQQLLPSMSEDIEAALNESTAKSRSSIFRVPQALAGGIAEACRPRIVSIGPYHHGESQLQMFQEHKWRYLRTMLDRTQPRGIHLESLIDVVAPKEKIIRQCYSESTDNFSGSDLVKMMVLDGCFIIELLYQLAKVQINDMLIINLFVIGSVMRDLLRLENQVPYFVLKDLFETINVPERTFSLADLAFHFFSCFGVGPGSAQKRRINLKGVHLLDLIRLSLIPSNQQEDNPVGESSSFDLIKSASELRRMGIRFKQKKANTFLEIKFDKRRRTIEIPEIEIYDEHLNWILINMVAFEQCSGQNDGHITAYAMFMGCLIRTANDVQLLRDCKVISNHGMSNEDFTHLFSDICKEASLNIKKSYLASSHYALLNESFKYERAYICRAQLLNAFHDNPWSALSGLAIIVTLVGMIQTVYAVLQYYHPK